jgi:hypothetical protein
MGIVSKKQILRIVAPIAKPSSLMPGNALKDNVGNMGTSKLTQLRWAPAAKFSFEKIL